MHQLGGRKNGEWQQHPPSVSSVLDTFQFHTRTQWQVPRLASNRESRKLSDEWWVVVQASGQDHRNLAREELSRAGPKGGQTYVISSETLLRDHDTHGIGPQKQGPGQGGEEAWPWTAGQVTQVGQGDKTELSSETGKSVGTRATLCTHDWWAYRRNDFFLVYGTLMTGKFQLV